MVLLLNYLPYLIIALGLFLCYRASVKHRGTDKVGKRIVLWLSLTIIAVLGLAALSNGYIGKAVGSKLDTPTVDELATKAEEAAPIRDVLRKPPKTAEQSDTDFKAMVDWRAAKAARENPPKPAPTTEQEWQLQRIEQIQEDWKNANKNLGATQTQELPLPAK